MGGEFGCAKKLSHRYGLFKTSWYITETLVLSQGIPTGFSSTKQIQAVRLLKSLNINFPAIKRYERHRIHKFTFSLESYPRCQTNRKAESEEQKTKGGGNASKGLSPCLPLPKTKEKDKKRKGQ